MFVFKALVYLFAAISLITGAIDLLGGLESQRNLGAQLTEAGFRDPALDNVFRFFAGLWFGVGAMLIVFVRDLAKYRSAMIVLLWVIFIGGIGRVLSIMSVGVPDHPVGSIIIYLGMFVELILCPIMAVWLARQKNITTTS